MASPTVIFGFFETVLAQQLYGTSPPCSEPGEITIPKVLVVVTYFVLFVIWSIIAWEVWSTVRRLHAPLGIEQTRRRLLTAGLAISLALALDFGYWMIDTAGRWGVVPGCPNLILEAPVLNILEKLPLVAAAGAFLWTFTMISRLTATEIEARYFSRFAEWAVDAITVLDPEGRIQYWNKRAEQMFGWSRYEVKGRRIQELTVPKDQIEEVEQVLAEVRLKEKAVSTPRTERLTATHNLITVSIDTAPILDPGFLGYFSIIRPAEQRNPFSDHPYFRGNCLPAIVRRKVFVAMPFSVHHGGLDIWDQLLEPLQNDLGLKLVRADYQLAARGVVDQVFKDIASAELVIADLTGNNPNVYYEVGLAHALGMETLHLILTDTTIPFNLSHLQTISCDPANSPKTQAAVRQAIIEKLGR